jgi:hypothetical protein
MELECASNRVPRVRSTTTSIERKKYMRASLLTVLGSLLLLSALASAQTTTAAKRRYAVPEPSMLALAGVGLAGVAGAIWRKAGK